MILRIDGRRKGKWDKGNYGGELYMNEEYKGNCSFQCTKEKMNKLEDHRKYVYTVKSDDKILFENLNEQHIVDKIV